MIDRQRGRAFDPIFNITFVYFGSDE